MNPARNRKSFVQSGTNHLSSPKDRSQKMRTTLSPQIITGSSSVSNDHLDFVVLTQMAVLLLYRCKSRHTEPEELLALSWIVNVRVTEHAELVELIGQSGCPESKRRGNVRG